jgi:hypothetical protein
MRCLSDGRTKGDGSLVVAVQQDGGDFDLSDVSGLDKGQP